MFKSENIWTVSKTMVYQTFFSNGTVRVFYGVELPDWSVSDQGQHIGSTSHSTDTWSPINQQTNKANGPHKGSPAISSYIHHSFQLFQAPQWVTSGTYSLTVKLKLIYLWCKWMPFPTSFLLFCTICSPQPINGPVWINWPCTMALTLTSWSELFFQHTSLVPSTFIIIIIIIIIGNIVCIVLKVTFSES